MGMTLLSEVEHRLHEVLDEHAGATHLIDAGGKRIRPTLVILGAEFGPRRDKVVDAAVLTELVHVGTLHHDDVMDQAPTRHGVPTANVLWGNNRAILLGDLMLARAAELGADLGLPALRLQTTTLARLVRGQLMETVRPKTADPMAFCLEVMADKSASLFAMAAELGALVAEAPPPVCRALHTYGEHLGIAFQLVDDVLDIVGAESGKTPGTDPELHAEALALLRGGPGPGLTLRDAREHAEHARVALADLPRGEALDALESLCDAVLDRTV